MNIDFKLSEISIEDIQSNNYDVSIHALGFETRARSLSDILEAKPRANWAYGFEHGNSLAYESTKSQYKKLGYSVFEGINDGMFEIQIEAQIHEALSRIDSKIPLRVVVDISCFNRYRLASLLSVLVRKCSESECELIVDFYYCLAAFEEPNNTYRPNRIVGPVHSSFAGWSQGGAFSTAVILGLGYEQDQAIGVVEHLQANPVWAFSPRSPIHEYAEAVRVANDLLIEEISQERILEYDVQSPLQTITAIESVTRGLEQSHNVVLVPSGPKIFVLCNLLVALFRSDVAVWRVSQGAEVGPVDRKPSDYRSCLRVGLIRKPIASRVA